MSPSAVWLEVRDPAPPNADWRCWCRGAREGMNPLAAKRLLAAPAILTKCQAHAAAANAQRIAYLRHAAPVPRMASWQPD